MLYRKIRQNESISPLVFALTPIRGTCNKLTEKLRGACLTWVFCLSCLLDARGVGTIPAMQRRLSTEVGIEMLKTPTASIYPEFQLVRRGSKLSVVRLALFSYEFKVSKEE